MRSVMVLVFIVVNEEFLLTNFAKKCQLRFTGCGVQLR